MTKKSTYGKVTKAELIDEIEILRNHLRLFHRYAMIPHLDYDDGWENTEARFYPLSLCIQSLKDWEKKITAPVAPPKREGRDHSTEY